jgi:hypothetical protein
MWARHGGAKYSSPWRTSREGTVRRDNLVQIKGNRRRSLHTELRASGGHNQ